MSNNQIQANINTSLVNHFPLSAVKNLGENIEELESDFEKVINQVFEAYDEDGNKILDISEILQLTNDMCKTYGVNGMGQYEMTKFSKKYRTNNQFDCKETKKIKDFLILFYQKKIRDNESIRSYKKSFKINISDITKIATNIHRAYYNSDIIAIISDQLERYIFPNDNAEKIQDALSQSIHFYYYR